MTTSCEVHLFTSSHAHAKKVAMEILAMAKRLEKKYNFYAPNSYLSALNGRTMTHLDPESVDILRLAKHFYRSTNGIFDVTVGTLKESMKYQTIEEIEREKEALQPYVGSDHFAIKHQKLSFSNPYTRIDLGGLVKEYAVDQGVKIVKRAKIESALLNFGGDIYALGAKPDGSWFKIGLKNPLDPSTYIEDIYLSNQAFTTSASYARNQQVEGKTYSHIMHTKELQGTILSASVLSPTVLQSGIYSTALMIDHELEIPFAKLLIDRELNLLS
jgi:thiamine biosynthesis lipoprotein